MSKPQCFIFDGNSFMFRAHHSMPAFTTKKGFPTGAMTGFFNMVNSVITKFSPEKTIFTFDAKGKNFRHEIFPEYKAHRPPTDPDLSAQFQPVKDIVSAWGYPILCKEGVEADDVMGTLAKMAVAEGYQVVIVTSDKDMRQMVTEDILILDTKDADTKGKPYSAEGVIEKMGVPPEYVRDLLAIKGDSADNVPGVPGVGETTAAKWINEFGGLESIIANADALKGAYGQKLRDNIENARLSYRLVVIDDNLELDTTFDKIVGVRDEAKLFELVSEYELNKFKNTIGVVNAMAQSADYTLASLDVAGADSFYQEVCDSGKYFAEISEDGAVAFVSSGEESDILYFDVAENLNLVEKLLNNTEITLVGNDTKNVLKAFAKATGCSVRPTVKVVDTRVINYVLNGGTSKMVSIQSLNDSFAEIELSPLRNEYKLDTDKPKWEKIQIEDLRNIKAEELVVAKKVLAHGKIKEHLVSYYPLNQDLALLPVLAQMEIDGVLVDLDYLAGLKAEFGDRISKIEKQIFEIAGQEFNVGSPAQVKKVLFEDLSIPSKKQSTDEGELSKIASDYPIAQLILDWRSLNKLITTYVDGLTKRATESGVVHTTYNQTITATSRLSSTDPNLQNIPIRTEDGRKIRQAFVARKGFVIMSADYSQIELRILAHGCQQHALVEAFKNDEDVHCATASVIFEVPLAEVTPEQRRAAKAINFGLIYGQGAKAQAEQLGIPLKTAKAYNDAYFEKYDMIKPFMDGQLEFAKENLFVNTFMGRMLLTRDVNTTNPMVRVHAELAAKNAPLQGTSADIIKEAMIKTALMISQTGLSARMLLQVHDELVFEVAEEDAETISLEIVNIMENAVKLSVPMKVEFGFGNNWLEAH